LGGGIQGIQGVEGERRHIQAFVFQKFYTISLWQGKAWHGMIVRGQEERKSLIATAGEERSI